MVTNNIGNYLLSLSDKHVFHGQLKEVVDTLKDDTPRLDSILMHMGSMYATLNKFEESFDTYQRTLYIVEGIYGECIFPLVMLVLSMIYYYYYLSAVNGCGYVGLLNCLIKRLQLFS